MSRKATLTSALALMIVFASVYVSSAATVVKEWSFTDRSALNGWRTSYVWEENNSPKGTVEWSPEFGGSVKMRVSGAPCVVNFWNTLPFDLEWGDIIRVEFSTKSYLHPISGFDFIVGPAEPYGHKQSMQVSVDNAGNYSVEMGIFYYWAIAGTRFGFHYAVWPGTTELYLRRIRILRQ